MFLGIYSCATKPEQTHIQTILDELKTIQEHYTQSITHFKKLDTEIKDITLKISEATNTLKQLPKSDPPSEESKALITQIDELNTTKTKLEVELKETRVQIWTFR